ncbi:putative alpha-mannosidase I MNS4 [Acorus gramineus]|uniref:alpha-1,2-Mannosidase n=1 Tax=Acorus gramineus TaxID=55184 RepID=A0AAV9B6B8_ACOGR|nr:putative alpha-mannosidase I MNS4 [Acorus gramineus]
MPSLALLFSSFVIISSALSPCALADGVGPEEARRLRDEVREMFYHAFDGYMQHAFPLDELRPLTCMGEDSLGGYALTLNKTVSVFETTIRILGGLLSAHLIASDHATGMKIQSYNDELLHLAEDLAQRLLPAFDTPTGIPYGSINLLHGVDENESKARKRDLKEIEVCLASLAGCCWEGSIMTVIIIQYRLQVEILELILWLNEEPICAVYELVTKNAVRGIWARRSKINLVGAHINVFTGEWTQKDAGIGTSIDSFYEYLLKAYLLFGDEEYLFIFQEAYKAAMQYLYHDPWYLEVNMNSANTVWPLFNSLQAFWPGLQVLAGDIDPAIRTHAAFFSVWKRYGFTPEGFNLATSSVQKGQKSYPLRPELIESTYWLFKATRDPSLYLGSSITIWNGVCRYLDAGRDMIASLQYGAKCPCGYCHIVDVESHKQDDHMESFFLAETVKYLWLLFDSAVESDNIVEKGPYKYIFSTEGHLLPATPEISLVHEHCSYFGSFCKPKGKDKSETFGNIEDNQDKNGTQSRPGRGVTSFSSMLEAQGSFSSMGFIKGFCPGLTHGQKFGMSYMDKTDSSNNEDESSDQQEIRIVRTDPVITVLNQNTKKSTQDEDTNPHNLNEDEQNITSEKEVQDAVLDS